MTVIVLNAKTWRKPLEFYDAILAALGSPDWHGRNGNALVDSIIRGSINKVERPYTVVVSDFNFASEVVREEVEQVFCFLAREGAKVTVTCSKILLELAEEPIV